VRRRSSICTLSLRAWPLAHWHAFVLAIDSAGIMRLAGEGSEVGIGVGGRYMRVGAILWSLLELVLELVLS